jgi:hypothetical protein
LSGTAASQQTGQKVSLSSTGNTVAVGAPGIVNGLTNCGKVQVYDYNGSIWVQKGQDLSGTAASQSFGNSVSLSSTGNTVAVGARSATVNGVTNCGKVQVYDYNGSIWVQKGQDLSGTAAAQNFGWSVSLSLNGTRVIIGAPSTVNGVLNAAGVVKVYDFNGYSWVQIFSNIFGSEANQAIGRTVSFSSDGRVFALGGTGTVNGIGGCGKVQVYIPDMLSISSTNINGQVRISENTGTYAGTNSGSIILEHANTNGASSLVFKASNNAATNDYAYIQYEDNTGYTPFLKYDLSAAYTTTDLCYNGISSIGSNKSLIKVGTADASINSVLCSTVSSSVNAGFSSGVYCLSFNQYNLTSASTANISYLQIQSTVNPFFTGFTFSAWINPKTITSAGCRFYLLNISSASATSNFDIYLDGDAAGAIVALIGDDSLNYRATSALSINTWYHYAFTFDNATSTGVHYRNGITSTISDFNVGTLYTGKTLTATNQTILIGTKYGYSTGGQIGATGKFAKGFNGCMNYVNMFDRALSPSEILILYNNKENSLISTEKGLMTIGIENDPGSIFNDRIALFPGGGTGFVGINTKNPAYTLDINGQNRILENTGSLAGTNSGSLILEHANLAGASSLVFRASNWTTTSDYAYIQYEDNTGCPLLRYDLSSAYTTTDLCYNGILSIGSNTSLIKVGTADASINSVLVSTVGGTIPSQLSSVNPYCLSFNQYNLTSASTAAISYAKVQSTVNPFAAGGFTFSAWIRPTTISSTNCQFYLLNISSASNTSKIDIYLDGDNAGQISALIDQDSINYKMTNTLAINTWYHYAFTFDNATSSGLSYINGALVDNTVGAGFAGKKLTATNQTILLGSKYGYPTGLQIGGAGKFAKGFHGYMNFVNIFDRALSASDILVLYNIPGYLQTTVDRGLMTIGIENDAGSVFNDRIALWPDRGTGFVGINTKTPAYTLDVSGDINASGSVRAAGVTLTSDYRIKEFVSPLDQSFNVDVLNPVSYYLKSDHSQLQIGFIAHEVQEAYPFLVTGVKDGDTIQSINYNGFIGILTKEIQALKRKDEENRDKIVAQESKIVAQESKIVAQESKIVAQESKIVAQEVRIQRLEEAVAELLKP